MSGVVESGAEPGSGLSRRRGPLRQRRVLGGRHHKVSVRFTDEEYQTVGARAAGQRRTVANYLARLGLAGSANEARREEEAQLVAHQLLMLRSEIARVGQNVNQVAHLLHGTGEVARHAEATYRGAARAMAAVEAATEQWRAAAGPGSPW